MLAIILQDKKTSDKFYNLYFEDLKIYPDEVVNQAAIECRRQCRFYPTIADFIEKIEPLMQEWNINNRKLLAQNEYSKCPENVWIDEKNNPRCKIEEDDPMSCKFSKTGLCQKWK